MDGGPRICIVGGGAAGLSAAWYLSQRGYKHVTVLEKAARAGGKCHSFSNGDHSYDLGAFTVTLGYRYVRDLARQLGAPLIPQPTRLGIRWDAMPPAVASILDSLRVDYSLPRLGLTALRYLWKLWQYRSVLHPPGFKGISAHGRFPELLLPFGEWTKQYDMEPLVELFRLAVTDMGYGHVVNLQAAYVIKYMNFMNVLTIGLYLVGLGAGWPKRFADGFERLWTRVAWRLDVRLGADIRHITRGETIEVEWTQHGEPQRDTFDHLILACPLDATRAFLDWSEDERALFEQIRYTRYFVTVCETVGMPEETLDAVQGLGLNHAWEIMHPWPHAPLSTFYSFGQDDVTPEQIVQLIHDDVARAFPAARVARVVHQICWPYFPHVSAAAMAGGYFDKLEAMQGERSTYLAGGLLSFETVETVVQYSHALVQRCFPPI
jgi:hypothetical protein